MRRLSAACLCLLLLAGSVRGGGQEQGKLVLDLWDVAYLLGNKSGFVRTRVHLHDVDGQKYFRTSAEMNLTVKRFKDTVQLRALTGTDETADGRVTGVFMRQQLGAGKTLVLNGKVVGKELQLTLDGKHALKPAPWDDKVVGLYRQQRLFQERRVKPGDKFSYRSFEPTVNLVVTTHVQVKDYEFVAFPGGKKQKLLRVEARPEKIEGVQLPTMVAWLGADLMPLRTQIEVPGLGQIVLYRTTREFASSPGSLATLTDIGDSQLVKLNRRLPAGYGTREAVYRVTLKGEEDVGTVFPQDERQQVKGVKGQAVDLQIRSARGPGEGDPKAKIGDEFTQSSYFINCDDAKVKEHARKAVGSERDPWKKALRIEKWVHDHMRVTSYEALATADHVARTLEGDCTEFAMLTAAMCRAEGVPSRTAIGLVYADVKGRPVMAFHMWTEVWIRGKWVGLDATLGHGYVGATHLKITDHSWHGRRDLAPLLPVIRVLGKGKMTIEIVSSQ
jgi:transglutaminase-like putative cysteine protease